MFHVHDGWRKTFRIPARAINLLAKFCNNLSPGFGIDIRRPEEPSASNPVAISVNTADLAEAGFAALQPNAAADGQTTAQLAEANAPEDVVEADDDETVEEKAARIGTSSAAARADHVHAFAAAKDNGARKDMTGVSGSKSGLGTYAPAAYDCTTWTRGTDKGAVSGETVDAGLKIMLPCLFATDGIEGYVRLRLFEFDQQGRLVNVGAETAYAPYLVSA